MHCITELSFSIINTLSSQYIFALYLMLLRYIPHSLNLFGIYFQYKSNNLCLILLILAIIKIYL